MLSVRCFKCGQSINLTREEMEVAVQEAEAKGETHHTVTCPHCRRVNKVSVKQMRRKLPRRRASTES
jgi:phage FluMu protein Com